MRRLFSTVGALAAAAFLAGCTVPPPLQRSEVTSLFSPMFSREQPGPVTAYGEVTFAVNGEIHSGGIEVRSDSGTFMADFYGPMGIMIGSIDASSNRGTMRFQGKVREFDLAQTIDSLPFGWKKSITFRELFRIMLGHVPPDFEAPLQKPADTIINGSRTITSLWKTDSFEISALIKKKPPEVREVVFIFKSIIFLRPSLSFSSTSISF